VGCGPHFALGFLRPDTIVASKKASTTMAVHPAMAPNATAQSGNVNGNAVEQRSEEHHRAREHEQNRVGAEDSRAPSAQTWRPLEVSLPWLSCPTQPASQVRASRFHIRCHPNLAALRVILAPLEIIDQTADFFPETTGPHEENPRDGSRAREHPRSRTRSQRFATGEIQRDEFLRLSG
jgi:hypothetical protein